MQQVIALPVAVNAMYKGFAVDPLYQEVSFMDINAFRYYMGLKKMRQQNILFVYIRVLM